jgi:hypothetical protein
MEEQVLGRGRAKVVGEFAEYQYCLLQIFPKIGLKVVSCFQSNKTIISKPLFSPHVILTVTAGTANETLAVLWTVHLGSGTLPWLLLILCPRAGSMLIFYPQRRKGILNPIFS